jgi:hypothetical protein
MSQSKQAGVITRRHFIAGSTGLAALGMMPPLLNAAASSAAQAPAPRTWLGLVDPEVESGTRIRPVGAMASTLRTDQPLLLRVRGPWSLCPEASIPDLTLSMIYRHSPHNPFLMWTHSAPGGPVSLQLKAHAAALAGVEVQCNGAIARCALTGLFNPALEPGHYVLLIDPTGRQGEPDWSALALDTQAARVTSSAATPGLTALLLDVRPG